MTLVLRASYQSGECGGPMLESMGKGSTHAHGAPLVTEGTKRPLLPSLDFPSRLLPFGRVSRRFPLPATYKTDGQGKLGVARSKELAPNMRSIFAGVKQHFRFLSWEGRESGCFLRACGYCRYMDLLRKLSGVEAHIEEAETLCSILASKAPRISRPLYRRAIAKLSEAQALVDEAAAMHGTEIAHSIELEEAE